MKTMIINASPRKNWNTALMLKEAQKGAASAGAETEYIDLFDLSFTGCHSCLSCKRKDAERNKCYWKDDLSPLIEKILHSDAVIIGTPIYMGDTTAAFRALYERLGFCVLSYDGGEISYFNSKVNVGIIYTMNAPQEAYEGNYKPQFRNIEHFLGVLLKGKVMSYGASNTLQVDDYSQYSMGRFDVADKLESRRMQFPKDLQAAFTMGAELSAAIN